LNNQPQDQRLHLLVEKHSNRRLCGSFNITVMASGLGPFGQDVSLYLLLIIAISTLGPLQFGFHLVRYDLVLQRIWPRVEGSEALQAAKAMPTPY
jgi:hypothetical protein